MVLACFLAASYETGYAKDHSIHIQFQYNTDAVPGKEVVGYNLYKNEETICNTGISETTTQAFECTFESPGGSFPFTLTALFDDETESPHSAPFSLFLVDESMVILGLQVLSGQAPENSEGIGGVSGSSTLDMADIIDMLRQ